MSFARIEGVDHGRERDPLGQRHLDDDAGDQRVAVEALDLHPERRRGRSTWHLHQAAVDADLLARPQDLVEVHGRRRVAADDDHGEGRRVAASAPDGLDVARDRRADLRGDRRTEQQSRAVVRSSADHPRPASIGGRASPPSTASRVCDAIRSMSSTSRCVSASSSPDAASSSIDGRLM